MEWAEQILLNRYYNPDKTITNSANQVGDILFVRNNVEVEFLDSFNNVKTTPKEGEWRDAHIAPGGRGDKGLFSLGMRPGETYIASVQCVLEDKLRGPLGDSHLEIAVDILLKDGIHWGYARSKQAPNLPGIWDLALEFTVPKKARGCWIRLQIGAYRLSGYVIWRNFTLVDKKNPLKDSCLSSASLRERIEIFESLPSIYDTNDLRNCLKYGLNKNEKDGLTWVFDLVSYQRNENHFNDTEHRGLSVALPSPELIAAFAERSCYYDFLSHLGRYYYKNHLYSNLVEIAALVNKDRCPTLFLEYLWAVEKSELKPTESDTEIALLHKSSQIGLDWGAFAKMESDKYTLRILEKDYLLSIFDSLKKMPFNKSAKIEKIPVFTYWAQGFADAPSIIKYNVNLAKKHLYRSERFTLVALDDSNVNCFIHMPNHIRQLHDNYIQQFSDYLRLSLLEQHGGIWLDPTVSLAPHFVDYIEDLFANSEDFVLFPTYTDSRIGNWFAIASHKHNYGIQLMLRLLETYWFSHKNRPEYFMFHTFWEILTQVDERLSNLWRESPKLSAQKGVAILRNYNKPLQFFDLHQAILDSPVHKLTYKYSEDDVLHGTVLAELIRTQTGILD